MQIGTKTTSIIKQVTRSTRFDFDRKENDEADSNMEDK